MVQLPRADPKCKIPPGWEVEVEAHPCVVSFQAAGENGPALVFGKGSSGAAGGNGATEDKKQRT